MIEAFVINKINQERQIFDDLWGSLPIDEKLTPEKIARSSLSEFTKNYILNIVEEAGDRDEILDRIAKANKLRFNYAIRPKWTLITYLFGNYESRPPTDIAKKLELFPFYNFYIDSINEVLKDNFSIFITRNEVSMIIDETNKAIYRKLTTDINNAKIKNFFLQIYSLKYNEQELNLESTVPYSFLKIFLNDKYYFDIEKKFQLVRGINDEYEISLKDVIKVLMNKYDFNEKEETVSTKYDVGESPTAIERSSDTGVKNESPVLPIFPDSKDKTKVVVSETINVSQTERLTEEVPELKSKSESPVETEIESKSEPKFEPKVEPIVEQKVEPIVEQKVEVKVEPKIEPKVEPKVVPKVEPKIEPKVETKVEPKVQHLTEESGRPRSRNIIEFVPEPKKREVAETKAEPVLEETAPSAKRVAKVETTGSENLEVQEDVAIAEDEPISVVKKLFTDKQFDKILDKVYNSDTEHVARSFLKLSNYKTWFEASNHLKEVFKTNRVDIYNKDVINFVDTLNDYFSERG